MDPRLLEAIERNDTPTFFSSVGENEGVVEQRTAISSNTTLHLASKFGHIQLVREIVKLQPHMVAAKNKKLETPLPQAFLQGNAQVLMLLLDTACCNGHLNVVKQLLNPIPLQGWDATYIILRSDQYDNTILHLAISGGHYHLAEYIINDMKVDINYPNYWGHTALDILDQAGSTLEIQFLKDMLEEGGGKRSAELSFEQLENEEMNPQLAPKLERPKNVVHDEVSKNLLNSKIRDWESFNDYQVAVNPTEPLPEWTVEINDSHHQAGEVSEYQDASPSERESLRNKTESRSKRSRLNKRLSERHRKELIGLYKDRHKKQHEIYREAVQNARNTLILIFILIATITFTAGISPLGGGDKDGKSAMVETTAFDVFIISNNIAFFISLGIVVVLVSVIPFQRKSLMVLLVVAHKAMWVAVSFMATGFVAATWMIIACAEKKTKWLFPALLAICVGTMGSVFVWLGVMLAGHLLRKLKWRKKTEEKIEIIAPRIKPTRQSHSTVSINSDVESSLLGRVGFHLY